ncbi:MAG: heavy-metal-associated domain-containing protein [Wenzhouxiangella sp.]
MKKLTVLFLCLMFSGSVLAEIEAQSIRAEVNGLVCAFCAQGITRALSREPAAADVFVSLQDRLVAVELNAGHDLSNERLIEVLTDAGYDVVQIERVSQDLASIRAEFGRGR